MSLNIPSIKPHKEVKYTSKQSKYDIAPNLPARMFLCGKSGSGKTILLQNFILDIYKNCFKRVYIFSPSIHVDTAWKPVIDYIEEVLDVNLNKEKCLFEEYNEEDLLNIIDQQKHVVKYLKDRKYKEIYNICIIIDDMLDNTALMKHSNILNSLFSRGRHNFITTIVSSQTYKSVSSIVRKNLTDMFLFKTFNQAEIESILEETTGIVSKKDFLHMYHTALKEPYNFFWIRMSSRDVNDMFYNGFNSKFLVE